MTDSYVERYDLISEFMCFDVWGDAYLQAGLEYHYRLNRKWDIGVLADWGVSQDSYFAYYFPSEEANTPDANIPSFTDGTDNIKWRITYQLTAIGATIGNQSFNLFGEIGYR